MKETRVFGSKMITINDGVVKVNGAVVACIHQMFYAGYRPNIKLELNNGRSFWFELDDSPLDKIFNTIQEETC